MIDMPPEELTELLKQYRQQMLKLKEEGSFHEVRPEATSVPIPEFEVHQDQQVPKNHRSKETDAEILARLERFTERSEKRLKENMSGKRKVYEPRTLIIGVPKSRKKY